jgi:hypothetical protein
VTVRGLHDKYQWIEGIKRKPWDEDWGKIIQWNAVNIATPARNKSDIAYT